MEDFNIIKIMWPLFVLVFFVGVVKILQLFLPEIKNALKFKKGTKWRSDRDLLAWLRGLSPKEFEGYISDLFSRLGHETKVTGRAYDKGIDVVAEKDGIKHYIQCKKFITQEVGVGAVRDFYGAIADHLARGKGYFITTNKFTLEAERFAEDKPIELVDSFKLLRYIRLTEKSTKKEGTKACPKCGGKLKERAGKYGNFLGCSNYPKCKYTENIEK